MRRKSVHGASRRQPIPTKSRIDSPRPRLGIETIVRHRELEPAMTGLRIGMGRSMIVSRRSFILGGAALAAARVRASAEQTEDGFTLLTLHQADARLLEGDRPATKLQSLSGNWPPPILRTRQGEEFKARFINELDHSVAMHWYGVRGP